MWSPCIIYTLSFLICFLSCLPVSLTLRRTYSCSIFLDMYLSYHLVRPTRLGNTFSCLPVSLTLRLRPTRLGYIHRLWAPPNRKLFLLRRRVVKRYCNSLLYLFKVVPVLASFAHIHGHHYSLFFRAYIQTYRRLIDIMAQPRHRHGRGFTSVPTTPSYQQQNFTPPNEGPMPPAASQFINHNCRL